MKEMWYLFKKKKKEKKKKRYSGVKEGLITNYMILPGDWQEQEDL